MHDMSTTRPPSPPVPIVPPHHSGLSLLCDWPGEKVTVATDDGFISAIERELATVGEVLWEEASENLARG